MLAGPFVTALARPFTDDRGIGFDIHHGRASWTESFGKSPGIAVARIEHATDEQIDELVDDGLPVGGDRSDRVTHDQALPEDEDQLGEHRRIDVVDEEAELRRAAVGDCCVLDHLLVEVTHRDPNSVVSQRRRSQSCEDLVVSSRAELVDHRGVVLDRLRSGRTLRKDLIGPVLVHKPLGDGLGQLILRIEVSRRRRPRGPPPPRSRVVGEPLPFAKVTAIAASISRRRVTARCSSEIFGTTAL